MIYSSTVWLLVFALPGATAFSLHYSKYRLHVIIQKGNANLHALFKGRICLIHASSDSHTCFLMNLYKQLNLQFFPALIGLLTSNSFASAKPFKMQVHKNIDKT